MNRQRKITSPTRPCGQELIIEAIEGWINVGQSITRVPTTEEFPATQSQLGLLKQFDKGIYTKYEITNFRKNKEREGFQKAIQEKFKSGACQHEGMCENEQNMPLYDLNKILSVEMNPMKMIENTIKDYGTYIALLVIILETIKAISFLIMIIVTYLQTGIRETIALAVSVLSCNAITSYRKIQRNKRKYDREEAKEAEIPLKKSRMETEEME